MLLPALRTSLRASGGAPSSSLRALSTSVSRMAQAPPSQNADLASERMKQLLLELPPEMTIKPSSPDSNKKRTRPAAAARGSDSKPNGNAAGSRVRKPQPRRQGGDITQERREGRQDRPPQRQARGGGIAGQQEISQGGPKDAQQQQKRPVRNGNDNAERRPQRREATDGQKQKQQQQPQRSRKPDQRSAATKREVPVFTPASLLQQLPQKEATEEDLFGTRSMLSEDAYSAALSTGASGSGSSAASEGVTQGEKGQMSEKESRAQAAARKAGDYTALLGNLKTADATKKMDPKSVFLTQAQVALARNASVTNGQRATAIKTLRDRLAI